ncbi:hypothetical protein MHUMG1_05130 [Metarhizium humberi]|uniref:Uncharacterized protein n=1 Tax=Metarhizium humberi TaxID=2596975 RepID=A0A9P8S7E9_9HYPO|nr:hypothetical protein MHUMG1_05130 [Metarhizium humberi]
MGLDLDAVNRSKRFIFVDGLTGLYVPNGEPSTGGGRDHVLRGGKMDDVKKGVEKAINEISKEGRKVVLLVDGMDAWLAMGGVGALGAVNVLSSWRERVHATVVAISADDPLLHAQNTTLEKDHAAFALSLAHEARIVMALRLLDTGTARDVSGVVRVTGGGKVDEDEAGKGEDGLDVGEGDEVPEDESLMTDRTVPGSRTWRGARHAIARLAPEEPLDVIFKHNTSTFSHPQALGLDSP